MTHLEQDILDLVSKFVNELVSSTTKYEKLRLKMITPNLSDEALREKLSQSWDVILVEQLGTSIIADLARLVGMFSKARKEAFVGLQEMQLKGEE